MRYIIENIYIYKHDKIALKMILFNDIKNNERIELKVEFILHNNRNFDYESI